MAAILGVDFTLVTPVGYEAEADMIEKREC
jgi:hypothetical protein